tara:strand:- start:618 stop:800 length:183 start_codon:yes stop_codon:yes gene_type:complete
MSKEKITADLNEAKDLVQLYVDLGEVYMKIGNRAKAYEKRADAIAQQSRVLNLEALLKAI